MDDKILIPILVILNILFAGCMIKIVILLKQIREIKNKKP
jgi:hypothetical protein